MGRKAQGPRYFQSRGAYYTTHKGKQVLLAVGPENDPDTLHRAHVEFARVQQGLHDTPAPENSTVESVLARYYTWLEKNRKPGTLALRKVFLGPFSERFGQVRVAQLRPAEVEAWLEEQAHWNSQSRRNCLSSVHACLNFAVKREWTGRNPLKGQIEMPESRSRGEENGRQITPSEHQRLIDNVHPVVRDLLIVMWETGCRPHELARAECCHYLPSAKCIELPADPRHRASAKTASSSGKRVIWLTPPCVQIVERLVAQHKTGPIFRDKRGRQWNHCTINDGMCYWVEKLGMAPGISPYSYRHTFCTLWILEGRSMLILAKLVGTSVKMLEKHYCTARNLGDGLPAHALDFHEGRQASMKGRINNPPLG